MNAVYQIYGEMTTMSWQRENIYPKKKRTQVVRQRKSKQAKSIYRLLYAASFLQQQQQLTDKPTDRPSARKKNIQHYNNNNNNIRWPHRRLL